MRRKGLALFLGAAALVAWLALDLTGSRATHLDAKEKTQPVGPDDVTFRLYQLLDTSHAGKLTEFYILADSYKDPKSSGEELQHILRAQYDKNRGFGRFNLYVRSVAKMDPEQLKAYTPKQVYEFGVADSEKFVKTDPGPFGRPGDMYLRAEGDRPLASSPITDDVRKTYETFLTQFVLPALEKK